MLLHLGAQLIHRRAPAERRLDRGLVELDRPQPLLAVWLNFLWDRHSFHHIRPDHRLVAFHIPGGLGSHEKIAHAGFHHIQAVQYLRAVLGVRDVCFRLAKQRAAIFSPFWPSHGYSSPEKSDSSIALADGYDRSEEHTSELQSLRHLVCRLLL